MLGYSPIAGSALASSGHEIIIVSLDHGSFAATGQAVGTTIALSDGFGTGSFAATGQTINIDVLIEYFGCGIFLCNGQNVGIGLNRSS